MSSRARPLEEERRGLVEGPEVGKSLADPIDTKRGHDPRQLLKGMKGLEGKG